MVKKLLLLSATIVSLGACAAPGMQANGLAYGVKDEGGGIYSISEMSTLGMSMNVQQAVKQCESEGKEIEILSQGQKNGMVSDRQYNQLIFKCK